MSNKPTSDVQQAQGSLLNKRSCLGPALDVTKFTNIRDRIWSHFVVLLKPDLDIQQTQHSLFNKGSCLARALGVTKFINLRYMILVTLNCAVLLKSDIEVQQTYLGKDYRVSSNSKKYRKFH